MDAPRIEIAPHPSLAAGAFVTELPRPLGEIETPAWLADLLAFDAPAPVARSEELRTAIRDLLRQGGYKPTGRGKPSSEYLLREASEGELPRINLVVDACNVVSLASGFPISVVDFDRARPPFRIDVAAEGASYVFNASGQSIDLAGLLCLFDADGPCANAVKDAQRTKTSASTRRTLSVVWGTRGFEKKLTGAVDWYRDLLERAGAATRR